MIKTLLVLTTLGVMISGCFMVPMAFIGPAASGFSTASITQSVVSTGASYMVKKNTGKTISEHAYEAIGGDINVIQQSYFPKNNVTKLILPESKPIQ